MSVPDMLVRAQEEATPNDANDTRHSTAGADPLRVLQIISVIAEVYGGPSTVAIELNRQLRASGIDARIISNSLNGLPGSTISNAERGRLEESGAAFTLYSPSWPWRLQGSWGMVTAIFRQVRNCDLLHIDGQYRIAHLVAFYAALIWQVPYGVQPHGTLDPYFRNRSKLGKAVFNFLTLNRYIQNATKIYFTADSEALAAKDVVREDQIVIVPLGASLVPPAHSEALGRRLDVVNRESLVLFLGRLAAKKRPDLLLEAWSMAALPTDALLVIAGPSDDFSIEELEDLAERLEIDSSVYFPGQVGGAEKSWLYSACAVFVLASENENFGLTVGEAMLAGCHVISSAGVAASGLLELSGSGDVISDMTPGALAFALEQALNSPGTTAESGLRAKEFACKHLGWTNFADVVSANAQVARQESLRRKRQTNG